MGCTVFNENMKIDIVIKLKLLEDNKVAYHTKKDAYQMMTKYNLLKNYLKDYKQSGKIIKLNDTFIIKIGKNVFWCEKFLDNFVKFIDNKIINSEYRLVSVIHQELKNLQKHIFQKSSFRHIIVDCQGCLINNLIILSDIEFSDTLIKFKYFNENILNYFIEELYNDGSLQRNVNYDDYNNYIEPKINQLIKELEEIKNHFKN